MILAAAALLAAGALLVALELRRGRPASVPALAGDALMTTGAAGLAVALAQGPGWPLAAVPAAVALAMAAGTAWLAASRRKAGRR